VLFSICEAAGRFCFLSPVSYNGRAANIAFLSLIPYLIGHSLTAKKTDLMFTHTHMQNAHFLPFWWKTAGS
jgi:hypothetical protein